MPLWGEPWGDPWGLDLTTQDELMATTAYVTLVDANEYFAERLGSAKWDAANGDKEVSLKMATRLIDTLCFVGSKLDPETQAQEFPRNITDELTADGDIPQSVQDATCEVALALLKGRDPEELASNSGVASESVGDASRSYVDRGKIQLLAEGEGTPSIIAGRLLREWLCDAKNIQLDRVG